MKIAFAFNVAFDFYIMGPVIHLFLFTRIFLIVLQPWRTVRMNFLRFRLIGTLLC